MNVNIICSWFLEGLLAVNPKWDQGQIKNLTENQILILKEEKGWHSTSDQLCRESRPQILDIRVSYLSSIPWLTAVVLKSKGKVEVHSLETDPAEKSTYFFLVILPFSWIRSLILFTMQLSNQLCWDNDGHNKRSGVSGWQQDGEEVCLESLRQHWSRMPN